MGQILIFGPNDRFFAELVNALNDLLDFSFYYYSLYEFLQSPFLGNQGTSRNKKFSYGALVMVPVQVANFQRIELTHKTRQISIWIYFYFYEFMELKKTFHKIF